VSRDGVAIMFANDDAAMSGLRSGSTWAPKGAWRGCCNTETKTGWPPPLTNACSEYDNLIN
jgi:hypothetical protein